MATVGAWQANPVIYTGSHLFLPQAPSLRPCPHQQAMPTFCDAFVAADGDLAAVALEPTDMPRGAVAARDAAFFASTEQEIVVMESLQESIRDMEKERQRIKTLKEDLSRKLKMARQRLQRLKKKAHPLTGATS